MAARGPSSSRRSGAGRREARPASRPVGKPVTPALPPTTRAAPGGTRITTRAVILLGVAVMLIASYTTSVHAWWQQRSEIAALEASNRAAEADIAELQDQKRRWNDPAYVRQQARERFGWVMPGEVGYRVIGVDGRLQGQSSTLEEPTVTPRRPWIERLWGSVEEAGREPVTESAAETAEEAPALEPQS